MGFFDRAKPDVMQTYKAELGQAQAEGLWNKFKGKKHPHTACVAYFESKDNPPEDINAFCVAVEQMAAGTTPASRRKKKEDITGEDIRTDGGMVNPEQVGRRKRKPYTIPPELAPQEVLKMNPFHDPHGRFCIEESAVTRTGKASHDNRVVSSSTGYGIFALSPGDAVVEPTQKREHEDKKKRKKKRRDRTGSSSMGGYGY